jgi:hypothetical protein
MMANLDVYSGSIHNGSSNTRLVITAAYYSRAALDAQQRTALAGARLANMLNKALEAFTPRLNDSSTPKALAASATPLSLTSGQKVTLSYGRSDLQQSLQKLRVLSDSESADPDKVRADVLGILNESKISVQKRRDEILLGLTDLNEQAKLRDDVMVFFDDLISSFDDVSKHANASLTYARGGHLHLAAFDPSATLAAEANYQYKKWISDLLKEAAAAIGDGDEAYKVVTESGKWVFDLEVKTKPLIGASVETRRAGDQDWEPPQSHPTPCSLTLPYARWYLRIRLEKYKEKVVYINPFTDKTRIVDETLTQEGGQ